MESEKTAAKSKVKIKLVRLKSWFEGSDDYGRGQDESRTLQPCKKRLGKKLMASTSCRAW